MVHNNNDQILFFESLYCSLKTLRLMIVIRRRLFASMHSVNKEGIQTSDVLMSAAENVEKGCIVSRHDSISITLKMTGLRYLRELFEVFFYFTKKLFAEMMIEGQRKRTGARTAEEVEKR